MPVHFSDPDRQRAVAALRTAGCVFAEQEADLLGEAASSPAHLADLIEQRCAGRPLEHVVGWAEFCGQRIAVGPGVFVPRPRTEYLVEQALREVPQPRVVVDLCCGSGALALVIAQAVPDAEIYAVDLDDAAVACAGVNLAGVGTVLQGDLYGPLPRTVAGRVDLVVANVPYVPTGHLGLLPAEARLHEPRLALDGGVDGLEVLRRVVSGAPRWLAAGGRLLSEVSDLQCEAALAACERAGLDARVVTSEQGDTTVLVARTLCP